MQHAVQMMDQVTRSSTVLIRANVPAKALLVSKSRPRTAFTVRIVVIEFLVVRQGMASMVAVKLGVVILV